MNDNIQLNITKLQTYFEELEKRIKSVERQMTTTTQISAISSCLAEIKIILKEYQSSYNSLIDEFNQHVTNANTKDNQNTTAHYGFSNDISSLQQKANTLQTNVENLISRVLTLETSGGGSGNVSSESCGNTCDYVFNYVNEYLINNDFYSPNFVMHADSSQFVDIKLKVQFVCSTVPSSSSKYTLALRVNNMSVVSNSYSYHTDVQVREINYRYIPTSNENALRIVVNATKYVKFDWFSIEVNGKNVMLDADISSVRIICFDNKYYIVKSDNTEGKIYYAVQDKNSLSLNEGDLNSFSKTPDLTMPYFDCTLMPFFAESTKYTYSTALPQSIALITMNHKDGKTIYMGNINETTGIFVINCFDQVNANRYSIAPGTSTRGTKLIAYTTNTCGAKTRNNIDIYAYSNGETEKFYNSYSVQVNFAKIGDTIQPHRGSLFQRSDGMWFYYPHRSSSNGRIQIDIGKNCTAFYQENDTINVYLCKGCRVFKYIISKSDQSTTFDAINLIEIIPGITKYVELLDGKALVYTYDKYKIIDTNEQTSTN